MGLGAPRRITELLGGGDGSFPRFVLQKVQIVHTLQLHKYLFLHDFWVGRTGWELPWVVGLDEFWIHASYILHREWLPAHLTHVHTHVHTSHVHAYTYIETRIYAYTCLSVCLYLRDGGKNC